MFGKGRLPNRADISTAFDRLRDLKGVLEFHELTSRDGLLDKQGDSRELFQKLDLDISPWMRTASEHRWASDDNSLGVFLLGHSAHEFVQVLADPSMFVGGFDETFTFLLENCCSAFFRRVYESDYFQPRPKLAEGS